GLLGTAQDRVRARCRKNPARWADRPGRDRVALRDGARRQDCRHRAERRGQGAIHRAAGFRGLRRRSGAVRRRLGRRPAEAARDLRGGGEPLRRRSCACARPVARSHAAEEWKRKMIAAGPRWYVVQTQANAEHKAVGQLGRQGFATYLPRYLKRRRHARRVEIVPRPLFPRYLFVSIDVGVQRWRSIYSTIGVSTLLGANDEPLPVAGEVVDSLKRREDGAGFVKLD